MCKRPCREDADSRVHKAPGSQGATMSGQDMGSFLNDYERNHGDDVVTIAEPVSADQEITAVVWEMAARGHRQLLRFTDVAGCDSEVVTNVFACRRRIERMLRAAPGCLLARYEELSGRPRQMREVGTGPVTENVATGADVNLDTLPLLTHFETDLGPYITSGVIVAEDPSTGRGNLSYHRAVRSSRTALATSLHSRGDLWRMLEAAGSAGRPMPAAMVIGAHPLFMLAASARAAFEVDEREIAGGLLGEPLKVIRTPVHGLRVPAGAEIVLEGVIDASADAPEGPFGEFTGYSSDRSTRNCLEVQAVLKRSGALWVDVVGGNSDEHLNLARVPREAEMGRKLMDRFPAVRAIHYPNSGTHFHCYLSVEQSRPGDARQAMLGLLGWDPYLKTVVAVDADVDITDDSEVLWALAAHFQPAKDLFVIDGLPGSPLDPSSTLDGSTSRLGLDATRGPDFDSVRIALSRKARARARALLDNLWRQSG